MANIDSLSVRITGDSDSLERAVDSAERSLFGLNDNALQTAAALEILEGRTDEAGDEMSQLARKSTTASGGVASLGISSDIASVRVAGLSAVTIGSLIPALVTLSAALVPVVAGLGGLAAVAGSIVGVGLVGVLGGVAARTEQLKEDVQILQNTILDEFGPAFEYAGVVMEQMLLMFTNVIDELVPAQDVVRDIGEQFLWMARTIIDTLPAFVELATTLAQEFLPPFNRWLEDILPELPGMISAFVDAFRRMIPRFVEAGRILREMLPVLLEFGFTALEVVGPALASLAERMTSAMETFNSLDASTQDLLHTASLILPILTAMTALLGGISAPVIAAVGAIAALGVAYDKNIGGIQTTINGVVSQMQTVFANRLPGLLSAFRNFWGVWGDEIMFVVDAIINILGTGLVNAVDVAFTSMTALLNTVADLGRALSAVLEGDFGRASDILVDRFTTNINTIISLFGRLLTRTTQMVNDMTGGVFEDLVNGLIGTINEIGSIIMEGADALGVELDIPEFEPIQMEQDRPSGRMNTSEFRQTTAEAGQTGPTEVNVNVEGDTDVIENITAEAIERQKRRTTRNTGGTTSPN